MPMSFWQRALRRSAGLVAIVAVALVAAPARAAETKSERATGKLVSYDAATPAIVVKEGGKDQTYHVKPEGSVLTRTTLTMNGKVAKFDELKPGMIAIVYWKPDPADAAKRVARKVDVPKIPREFQEDVDAAEKSESQ
jgi:hypothetical protein